MARTEYLWDDVSDTLIGEYDENGDQIASYTMEPEQFGNVISQHRADSGSSYYHHDAQGNTVALTDQNQNVTDTYAYTAFGETVERTGATTNPFGFGGALGYYANPESGDHYVRARMYRAAIARWLSVDPLKHSLSMRKNRYLYVANDPMNGVDPSGLITIKAVSESLNHLMCGDKAAIQWNFILDEPAPCDGYFVQEVTARCKFNDCTDCPTTFPATAITYYEAWYVEKGQTEEQTVVSGQFTYADEAFHTQATARCGVHLQTGSVRFYCMDPDLLFVDGVGTRDLGRYGQNPTDPASNWRIQQKYPFPAGSNCSDISAGDLPSVGNKPAFWDRLPIEGLAYRGFGVNVNCCKGCKKFFKASGYPRLQTPSTDPPGIIDPTM